MPDRPEHGDEASRDVGSGSSTGPITRHTLGAGSEAAEGIHAVSLPVQPPADSALDARETGVGARSGAMRAGSEPLDERTVVHDPGYGGEGGAPRTPADAREHLTSDGKLESED